jgi:hypothetical protein
MLLLAGATTKDDQVCGSIDDNHESAQPPLKLAREEGRVKNGNEVVLDESGRVDRPAAALAKPVLKGRERTDPARKLDIRTPTHRREMHPSRPRPARDESTTEEHEQNEGEMEDNRGVGEDAEGHDAKDVGRLISTRT